MSFERIDKILSNISNYSRSDIKRMAKDGKVIINGKAVTDCSQKIDCNKDEIIFDGSKIALKKNIYIMMNKPKGVVSASEGKGNRTVVDLVPEKLFRNGLFPAGRLDKDTTGFVLITDDGDFAHKILSPKNHINKTYIAKLSLPLNDADVCTLSQGIELKDGTVFRPAVIKKLANNEVKVIIHEGKYHQIKRMFKAVDNEVVELNRIRMGNLDLDTSLGLGECRELTEYELNKISE